MKSSLQFVHVGQTLSASFRLRVQQKTQEKMEQKERRRQDREQRRRQSQGHQQDNSSDPTNVDVFYDNDFPTSATSSRYSSQPDLASATNDIPPTPRRAVESNIPSILPNVPSQARLRGNKSSYVNTTMSRLRMAFDL